MKPAVAYERTIKSNALHTILFAENGHATAGYPNLLKLKENFGEIFKESFEVHWTLEAGNFARFFHSAPYLSLSPFLSEVTSVKWS